MGHVLYVGWATNSRATVMIRLYVFFFKKKKKKKKKRVVTLIDNNVVGSWTSGPIKQDEGKWTITSKNSKVYFSSAFQK